MLAVTIWQPWASLIVGSPTCDPQKPVENRDWRPAESLIGARIAIHAGLQLDIDAFEDIFLDKAFGEVRPPYRTPGDFPRGAIVGVGTLDRVIALQHRRETIFEDERFDGIPKSTIDSWGLGAELRWFVGRCGWVFRDRRHLPTPVPCKGAQGLWTVPVDVAARIEEQLR
jgi:hypothetical protein